MVCVRKLSAARVESAVCQKRIKLADRNGQIDVHGGATLEQTTAAASVRSFMPRPPPVAAFALHPSFQRLLMIIQSITVVQRPHALLYGLDWPTAKHVVTMTERQAAIEHQSC